VVLALAWLVSGCSAVNPGWTSKPIQASQSVIQFDHPDFEPKLADYLVQRDPRSGHTAYVARLAGAHAFAIIVAMKAGPGFVLQERATESHIVGLLKNDTPIWGGSGRTVWGESGRTMANGDPVAYRMFLLPDRSATCVGFVRGVGEPLSGPNYRTDGAIGFFCEKGADPMPASTAETLITSVWLTHPR
jgi:hypothetical protein